MSKIFDISYILTSYGYMGVFLVVFLESGIIFALPGDSLLFTAGVLASGLGFKIPYLLVLISTATFLGGIAGYQIGKYLERLHKYEIFRKILRQDHIDRAHEFFEKHGMGAILFSRFVPVVRTFLPIVAGIAKMDFIKFIKFNLIGSILWSVVMTMAGYFLGIEFPQIHKYIHYLIFVIILVSLIPIAFEWWRVKRRSLSQAK